MKKRIRLEKKNRGGLNGNSRGFLGYQLAGNALVRADASVFMGIGFECLKMEKYPAVFFGLGLP